MLFTPPNTAALLGLWEAACSAPPAQRSTALLHAAGGPPVSSMGASNAQLVGLHAHWFGPHIALVSHCPACAGAAEFSVDAPTLATQLAPAGQDTQHCVQLLGYEVRFRLPTPDDTTAVAAAAPDPAAFARELLALCITRSTQGDVAWPTLKLPDEVLDAVSQRMEALDPGAVVSFALDCPQCTTAWLAPLDVGDLLWRKVRDAVERLLLDVDALARAYGWSEPEVLALSPLRRAAYVQMAAS